LVQLTQGQKIFENTTEIQDSFNAGHGLLREKTSKGEEEKKPRRDRLVQQNKIGDSVISFLMKNARVIASAAWQSSMMM